MTLDVMSNSHFVPQANTLGNFEREPDSQSNTTSGFFSMHPFNNIEVAEGGTLYNSDFTRQFTETLSIVLKRLYQCNLQRPLVL